VMPSSSSNGLIGDGLSSLLHCVGDDLPSSLRC